MPVCPRFAESGLTLRQDDQNTSPSDSTPPAAHKVLGDSVRVNFSLGEFPKYYFAFLLAQLVPFSLSPLPRFAKPGRQHTAMVFDTVCPPPPSKTRPSTGRLSARVLSSTPTRCLFSLVLKEGKTSGSFPSEFLLTSHESESDVPPPPRHHHQAQLCHPHSSNKTTNKQQQQPPICPAPTFAELHGNRPRITFDNSAAPPLLLQHPCHPHINASAIATKQQLPLRQNNHFRNAAPATTQLPLLQQPHCPRSPPPNVSGTPAQPPPSQGHLNPRAREITNPAHSLPPKPNLRSHRSHRHLNAATSSIAPPQPSKQSHNHRRKTTTASESPPLPLFRLNYLIAANSSAAKQSPLQPIHRLPNNTPSIPAQPPPSQ